MATTTPTTSTTKPYSVQLVQGGKMVTPTNARGGIGGKATFVPNTSDVTAPQTGTNTDVPAATASGTASAQTSSSVPSSSFSINIPDTIPSSTIGKAATYNDVLASRNTGQSVQDQYDSISNEISSPQASTPLQNPDAFISKLLLSSPTADQTQLDNERATQAQTYTDQGTAYDQATKDAATTYNVAGLTTQLQDTRTQQAQVQEKLRKDLRAVEINAKDRGVARPFVEDHKAKITADATAELADLSIIEAAQTGNLQLANDQVTNYLDEKQKGFDLQNKAIQSKIDSLSAIDTRQAQQRANQLQVALDTRKTENANKLADDKEIRGYLIDAASNGADTATLTAIRNAKTPAEAALLAGPFSGLLARQQAQASTYASSLAARKSLLELAQSGDPTAIKQLGYNPSASTSDYLSVTEAQALGVPYGTTKTEAMAMGKTPAKPATAVQEQTALYANRLQQASAILDKLDSYVASANPAKYAIQKNLPDSLNGLKGGDIQSIDQAQQNFVNAVLRRESGAAILPSEFANASRQYFAQPGDTPQTIAQKKANRDLVTQGFVSGSGSAYTPLPDYLAGGVSSQTAAGGDPYASYRSQLQPGEILVNRGGQAVAVTADELQATDVKL